MIAAMIAAKGGSEVNGANALNSVLKDISRKGCLESLELIVENGGVRFSDLVFSLGLNPAQVDRVLKALLRNELVEYNDRVYTPTDKGKEVFERLKRLEELMFCSPR